ncbi:DUF4998 domain-containing protein [Butyricimonas virosa]|mgnify:FL=1|uniref:DUF4998 domain-containing protein n=1 Tax=Butyricimonas virosa TaxID=544645 RepID=UPI00242B7E14|nr:DUF4998 domain-containing protein [Butyricimonas virosa]
MKMNRYLVSLLTAMSLWTGCSESLEDTYSDFAGDGKIRYVGKCSEIIVSPGWERLSLTWKNGTDATVENIKISWTGGDVERDTLLDRTATSCELRNLEDFAYRIDVRAVGNDGRESLTETTYGRPYTEAHEVVRSFTRGITKFYMLNDQRALVYFTDKWNSNVVDMKFYYTGGDNEQHEQSVWTPKWGMWELAPTFYTFKDVNTEEPIYITRVGKIESCPDTIHFDPVILEHSRNFVSDFKTAIQRKYGFTDQTEAQKMEFDAFVDTVRCLEFDYDISSFEDVLYFPKLEKIILGKNRFIDPTKMSSADASVVSETTRSKNVLKAANDLLGLKIERYNGHYSGLGNLAFMESMNGPELPLLSYLPKEVIDTITCSIPELVGHDSHLDYLVDNDPATCWAPFDETYLRTYEIVMRFKSPQMVRGFKIQQSGEANMQNYFPNQVRIQVSNDQVTWKSVTHTLEHPLGRGIGEVTLLPMVEPAEIKYVKITVTDQVNLKLFGIRLADVIPYK